MTGHPTDHSRGEGGPRRRSNWLGRVHVITRLNVTKKRGETGLQNVKAHTLAPDVQHSHLVPIHSTMSRRPSREQRDLDHTTALAAFTSVEVASIIAAATSSPSGRLHPDRERRAELRQADPWSDVSFYASSRERLSRSAADATSVVQAYRGGPSGGPNPDDLQQPSARLPHSQSWISNQAWLESLRYYPGALESARGEEELTGSFSGNTHGAKDIPYHAEAGVRTRAGLAVPDPAWRPDQVHLDWSVANTPRSAYGDTPRRYGDTPRIGSSISSTPRFGVYGQHAVVAAAVGQSRPPQSAAPAQQPAAAQQPSAEPELPTNRPGRRLSHEARQRRPTVEGSQELRQRRPTAESSQELRQRRSTVESSQELRQRRSTGDSLGGSSFRSLSGHVTSGSARIDQLAIPHKRQPQSLRHLHEWELKARAPDFRHTPAGDPRRANEEPAKRLKHSSDALPGERNSSLGSLTCRMWAKRAPAAPRASLLEMREGWPPTAAAAADAPEGAPEVAPAPAPSRSRGAHARRNYLSKPLWALYGDFAERRRGAIEVSI